MIRLLTHVFMVFCSEWTLVFENRNFIVGLLDNPTCFVCKLSEHIPGRKWICEFHFSFSSLWFHSPRWVSFPPDFRSNRSTDDISAPIPAISLGYCSGWNGFSPNSYQCRTVGTREVSFIGINEDFHAVFVFLSVYLFIYLSSYLTICLSIYMYVCIYLHISKYENDRLARYAFFQCLRFLFVNS